MWNIKRKKKCTNQTEHCFDYPLTGSLSWWLCLTTKQTVIHMTLLWPHFHLEQFHRGHWKQRSWQVRDLNPSPASAQQPLPQGEKTTPCVNLHLRRGLFMLAAHLLFSGGDTRVTAKNSRQVACHFPVVLVKVVFAYYRTVSWSQWGAFSVSCKAWFQKCIYFKR